MPRTDKILIGIGLVLGIIAAAGCATKRTYHFTAKSVTRISYDPAKCTELPDGRFKCKDVVFTVSSIEPNKN
jgi:hypothetical protein